MPHTTPQVQLAQRTAEEVRAVEARVRLAQAAMAHRDTSVSALCREIGIEAGDAPQVRRAAG